MSGKTKYRAVIDKPTVQWTTPKDPEGYDKTIQAKGSSFDRSKGEKKHARKVIEYKTFLGVEERIRTLMLQAMEELYLETLKEDYIGYGGQTPFKMVKHLQMKISKVTNKDKMQLVIMWEQPQVLSTYFKQIDKARTQLTKWKEKFRWWHHDPCCWPNVQIRLVLQGNNDKMGRDQQQQQYMEQLLEVLWECMHCKEKVQWCKRTNERQHQENHGSIVESLFRGHESKSSTGEDCTRDTTNQARCAKWQDSIHSSRLQCNIKLWMGKWPFYLHMHTISKGIPNTIRTSSKSIQTSKTHPSCARTSKNGRQCIRFPKQLTIKCEHICRCKLHNSIHTEGVTNFWLWLNNNLQHRRAHTSRVEKFKHRTVVDSITPSESNKRTMQTNHK